MSLICSRCLQPIGLDTPYRAWINSGRCRACLVARSESGNECSWCLELYWIDPKPNESHGICKKHADEMVARAAARRGAA